MYVKPGLPCKPSRRVQALVDEYAQGQSCLTPESHHRINTYYTSIDRVLSELKLRFSGNDQDILSALGDICHSDSVSEMTYIVSGGALNSTHSLTVTVTRQMKKASLE